MYTYTYFICALVLNKMRIYILISYKHSQLSMLFSCIILFENTENRGTKLCKIMKHMLNQYHSVATYMYACVHTEIHAQYKLTIDHCS